MDMRHSQWALPHDRHDVAAFADKDGKKYAFHLLPCGMINKDM